MPVEVGIICSIVLWNYLQVVFSQLLPNHIEPGNFGLIRNAIFHAVISGLFNTFAKRIPINQLTAPARTEKSYFHVNILCVLCCIPRCLSIITLFFHMQRNLVFFLQEVTVG